MSIVTNVLSMLNDSPYQDTHTNAPNASATSLTVATDATTRYEVGDIIEWRDDGSGEIAIITAVAATTLTIRRGYLSSTAASHAANATFVKNPRFYYSSVTKAQGDAIAQDLYPDIYAVYQTTITPTSEQWYSISARAEEILRAYQKSSTSPTRLVSLTTSQPEYVDSTLSATEKAVYIPLADANAGTIFVQYLVSPTTAELSDGGQRIIEYGMCKRLLEWEAGEITADESLKASGSIQPGVQRVDAAWFTAEQDRLRRREKQMLDRRFRKRQKNWFGSSHVGDYRLSGNGQFVFPQHSEGWWG